MAREPACAGVSVVMVSRLVYFGESLGAAVAVELAAALNAGPIVVAETMQLIARLP